jgi:type I restriction enzyme S subunit
MGNLNKPQIYFPEFTEEWVSNTLGDIARFSKGKGLPKSDISENGVRDCVRYGELYTIYNETIDSVFSKTNINSGDLVLSEANDIIIPASGETQIDIAKASCLLKSGVVIGGDLNIIKTSNNGVFLSYYLNSKKKNDIAQLAQGISIVHLYSGQLSKLQLNLPSLTEQHKLASFFTAIDKKISQLKRKKILLEQYKKGTLQELFSQKIRFRDANGHVYPKWEKKKLSEVLYEHLEINDGNKYSEVFSVAKQKGVINQIEHLGRSYSAKDIAHYKIIRPYDIVYTKSPTSEFPFGIIKQNMTGRTGVVSPLYGVFNPQTIALGFLIHNYFLYWKNAFNYLHPLVQKGAKNTMNINNNTFLNGAKINLPVSEAEQTKIAGFFTAIDDKIYHVQKQIEKAAIWKQGVLQQMLC